MSTAATSLAPGNMHPSPTDSHVSAGAAGAALALNPLNHKSVKESVMHDYANLKNLPPKAQLRTLLLKKLVEEGTLSVLSRREKLKLAKKRRQEAAAAGF